MILKSACLHPILAAAGARPPSGRPADQPTSRPAGAINRDPFPPSGRTLSGRQLLYLAEPSWQSGRKLRNAGPPDPQSSGWRPRKSIGKPE